VTGARSRCAVKNSLDPYGLFDPDGASLRLAEPLRDLFNLFLADITTPINLLIGVMTNIASDTYRGNSVLTRSGLDCTTRDRHNKCNLMWSLNLARKNSGLGA
jgi:hypothetical protein